MEITVLETPEQLAEQSARKIAGWMIEKPDSLCCFAAGFTQNDTYAALIRLMQEQNIPAERLRVVGLDEWGGLNGSDPGSCRAYLDERFFKPLGLTAEPLFFFDGKKDPGPQCLEADQILDRHGPIDILVLGLGMNGHVGFNEPGDDPGTRSHHRVLDTTTVTVGGKYFNTTEAPKTGLTLGLRDLLQASHILLQATGAHKAPVVRSVLTDPVSPDCPASLLRETGAYFYLDKSAYAQMQ